jgi:phosphatidate cytidylyltransferase
MKKIIKRVLLFVIGIPVLFSLIFLVPWRFHLALNACAVLFSVLGALEATRFFRALGTRTIPGTPAWAGIIPVLAYCETAGILPHGASSAGFVLIGTAFLSHEVFISTPEKIPGGLGAISASLFIVFYTGFLMSYIVRLTGFSDASFVLAAFLLIVFANDTFAYIFGMLFGKRSRGLIAVSPNKSLVGFISGFLFSVGVSILFWAFRPGVFGGSLATACAAGAVLGVTAICGDLAESAMKRSAGVKDSGTIMLGRGGILDSIDSLLFSAPFFFCIIRFALG